MTKSESLPNQPLTNISPLAFGPGADIGVSGKWVCVKDFAMYFLSILTSIN